jgi:hypothetical protein
MIERYLDDLEARIDSDVEQQLRDEWLDFTFGRCDAGLFTPQRARPVPSKIDWPAVSVNDAIDDFDRMALQQFKMCSDSLAAGSGALMCVRANYGTSILPSLFGAEMFFMDEELNTLPTSRPLAGGIDAIRAVVDAGMPDLHQSLGAKTLEMGQRFVEMVKPYPKISQYVSIYHPDLQGPMDICEVLWGSGLFLDAVDHPNVVKALLELITNTYIAFMTAWLDLVPNANDHGVHWSLMHRGHIVLRDDSAMNFSPQMFDEFIRPYDQRLLDAFGGGMIHFCGRGDHYLPSACDMPGLSAIHMSQPEYNDMEIVFRSTIDRGIKLLALRRQAAEDAVATGRDLHGHVHCW